MQDEELFFSTLGENDWLEGSFWSDTVFNLSSRILSDSEIKLLEKGLDYRLLSEGLMSLS